MGHVIAMFTGCDYVLWISDRSCNRCVYRLWVGIVN